jgi:hypothetical protein
VPVIRATYSVTDLDFATDAAAIAGDDLVAGIRKATGSDAWSDDESILYEDSGLILIRATPDMHQKVATVLADVREHAASTAGRSRDGANGG